MASVVVADLNFVDVSTNSRGNFSEGDTLTRFLGTEVGKAQERLMRNEMAAQMNRDLSDPRTGIKPEDVDITSIRRALILEQYTQDTNYTKPNLTTAELIRTHGTPSLQQLGDLTTNFADSLKRTVEDATRALAGVIHTHITTEGATGTIAVPALTKR